MNRRLLKESSTGPASKAPGAFFFKRHLLGRPELGSKPPPWVCALAPGYNDGRVQDRAGKPMSCPRRRPWICGRRSGPPPTPSSAHWRATHSTAASPLPRNAWPASTAPGDPSLPADPARPPSDVHAGLPSLPNARRFAMCAPEALHQQLRSVVRV